MPLIKVIYNSIKDLIGASTEVAFAVRHVRIAALASIAEMLPGVRRCRVAVRKPKAAERLKTSDVIVEAERSA